MADHPNAALVNQTLGHVMEWMEKRDFQGVNCAPCGFTPMVSDGQVAEANSPFNESEPKAACCSSFTKACAGPTPAPPHFGKRKMEREEKDGAGQGEAGEAITSCGMIDTNGTPT